MKQENLFPGTRPVWIGRARTSDPDTSKQAAEAILVHIGDAQMKALDAVRRSPGHTSQELADIEGVRDPRSINRRLGELEKLGALIRGTPRRCTVTGRNAAVWTTPATAAKKEPPR